MQSTDSILSQITELYDRAVETLRADILAFARSGTVPPAAKRLDGSYAYPELVVRYAGEPPASSRGRAYGRLNAPGTYATTVTKPALFAAYLTEQLEIMAADYEVEVEVPAGRGWVVFHARSEADLAPLNPGKGAFAVSNPVWFE